VSEGGGKALPGNWTFCRLADIAQLNPPLDRCVVADDVAVDFVPMRAVEQEGGGVLRPEIATYGEVKKGYTAFIPGDVIMAKITLAWRTVRRVLFQTCRMGRASVRLNST
jgi:type I restriction enzyme S subunit